MEKRVEQWAAKVKTDLETPDLWAELQREREILTCRQIDRPIRPLFPETFRNETQIISLVLSADTENDPDVCAINGASAALSVGAATWAAR